MKRKTERHWLAVLILLILVAGGLVVGVVYNVTIGAAVVIIALGLLIARLVQKAQPPGPAE